MRIRNKFLFLLFLLPSLVLLASFSGCKEKNEDYPPKLWSNYFYKTEYISARPISAILWESTHSRWLGSQNTDGLIYDDGYGWKMFNSENTGIEHKGINSLLRTPDQLLWEANQNGLHFYTNKKWTSLLVGKKVTHIAAEGVSNLWIGIENQETPLAHFKNGNLIYYQQSNLPFEVVHGLCVDSLQNLWLATNKGLCLYSNEAFQFIDLPKLAHPQLIASSPNSGIWISSDSYNLTSISNYGINTFNTGSNSGISNLLVLKNGNVWCMTYEGDLLSKTKGGWILFKATEQGLPTAKHLTLAEGPDGYLLISYEDGRVISFKYE